jgi:GYF domain 2
MSNLWYCEDNEESVGPLTLIELKAFLSRAPDSNNVLVWREGMANWQRASGVPELAFIAALPQPSKLGPSAQRIVTVRPDTPKTKSNIASFIYSLVIIALFAGGSRFLSGLNRTVPPVDLAKQISGSARDAFVKEGVATCLTKQTSAEVNKSLSLSRERLASYCSCYMNSLADLMTFGDLKAAADKEGAVPAWLQSKIDSADKLCEEQLRKGLLGG